MEDRREHIVSATLDCLRRLGLARTSLADICSAAGISRGALYVHFSSKDEILDALIARLERESLAALSFDDAAALRRSLRAHVRQLLGADGTQAALVEMELILASRANEALHAGLARGAASRYRAFEQGLRRLAEAGQLAPGVDTQAAAHAILSFLTGMLTANQALGLPLSAHLSALDLVLAPVLGA